MLQIHICDFNLQRFAYSFYYVITTFITYVQKFNHHRFVGRTAKEQENSSSTKISRKFFKDGKKIAPSRSHLAFGFGKGKCPGQNLAIMEIKLITIVLFTFFNPSLETNLPPQPNMYHVGLGILPPKDSVKINLPPKTTQT